MKLAIMQPYFLPYLGYWQLMNVANKFVVYDNIKYTKKGWINRNNYCNNGNLQGFSLPLKKASDSLDIRERYLSDNFSTECSKMLRKFEAAYKKAPEFSNGMSLLERCLVHDSHNLYDFLYNSIEQVKDYLCIETELVKSSTINIDHELKGQSKVLEICNSMNSKEYINPIGGLDLYSKETFNKSGINLNFIEKRPLNYNQGKASHEFIDNLSIIDLIMWNNKDDLESLLLEFDLK